MASSDRTHSRADDEASRICAAVSHRYSSTRYAQQQDGVQVQSAFNGSTKSHEGPSSSVTQLNSLLTMENLSERTRQLRCLFTQESANLVLGPLALKSEMGESITERDVAQQINVLPLAARFVLQLLAVTIFSAEGQYIPMRLGCEVILRLLLEEDGRRLVTDSETPLPLSDFGSPIVEESFATFLDQESSLVQFSTNSAVPPVLRLIDRATRAVLLPSEITNECKRSIKWLPPSTHDDIDLWDSDHWNEDRFRSILLVLTTAYGIPSIRSFLSDQVWAAFEGGVSPSFSQLRAREGLHLMYNWLLVLIGCSISQSFGAREGGFSNLETRVQELLG